MHKRNEQRLAIFLWLLIAIPASALVYTQALSMLWRWYLRPQYGFGPSFEAWYGVSMIIYVLTHHLQQRASQRVLSDRDFGEVVTETVDSWVLIGVAVAITYTTGAVFGWIP